MTWPGDVDHVAKRRIIRLDLLMAFTVRFLFEKTLKMSFIVFLVVSRILALKENFLLKFKMDVSLKSLWKCFLNLNLPVYD